MEMALFVFFFFILKIIHALWEKFTQCRRVKAESRADPQMLLARPNSFGIWLFFFFFLMWIRLATRWSYTARSHFSVPPAVRVATRLHFSQWYVGRNKCVISRPGS